jgi:hypothetical protein
MGNGQWPLLLGGPCEWDSMVVRGTHFAPCQRPTWIMLNKRAQQQPAQQHTKHSPAHAHQTPPRHEPTRDSQQAQSLRKEAGEWPHALKEVGAVG